MRVTHICAAFAVALAGMAPAVQAQATSTNQVATKTSWSVFQDDNPKECWAVSTFTESVNTRDGKVANVNRGDILLMVFFRPSAGANAQVAFTGGYPFASGSVVTVAVDGNSYEFFTDGAWAWPATTAEDAKLVTAMKRGSEAVLTARSSRGTTTKDTFSLLGFTAAVEDAEKRCG